MQPADAPMREPDRLAYTGHWEYLEPRAGAGAVRAARSYHAGDALTVIFHGEFVHIFGITGPQGGRGLVVMPGMAAASVSFHSMQRRAHVLVYASPPLAPGLHSLAVVVERPSHGHAHGYVNVDAVEVGGAAD